MADDQDHIACGNRALSAGDALTARAHYTAALSTNPRNFDALVNLAVVHLQTGNLPLAEFTARRALDINAASAPAWNNLGYIFGVMGRFEECKAALLKSIALAPSPAAWHSLGLCHYSLGDFADSVVAFDQQLELTPGDIDGMDKRSISLLGMGNYRDGLIDNKVRWSVLAAHPLMHSSIPEWNGEDITGKSIIVLHEQGYGDTLQFIRFVPWLKQRGARRVVLSVPGSAIPLFRDSNLADELIGINDMPAGGLASIDYKCPMLTLAAHLDVTPANIPGKSYLRAPDRPSGIKRDGSLNVGLVWAGKPMYAQDRWRSMNLMELLPLLSDTRCNFYSLQCDARSADLHQSGMNAFIKDLSPQIRDWGDTAAMIRDLDVLVSVDTAPAHLAGAMGKRVLLMIPQASCWRWLDHDTTATPWYPSMTIYRQTQQGDWSPVVDAICKELAAMSVMDRAA